jgi:predicted AAA+ superfamily ATPase
MELRPRFFQDPGQSFFLFGPRGTGKSTWIGTEMDRVPIIDLLDVEVFRSYSARPERLREVVEACDPGTTIVLDEIQKVPQILDVVHRLIEADRGWRFVLTGSSARKLKRSGVDLLAGRAIVKTMHPFMAAELGRPSTWKRPSKGARYPSW